jgi:hypothetical protein
MAERATNWVMCSIRPMKSYEVVAAIRYDPDSHGMRPVDADVDFDLHACHNLLIVDAPRGTCGFSHLPVQEYFESRVWTLGVARMSTRPRRVWLCCSPRKGITTMK